jgi:Asp-tRNA(Asn)/Glu-tRNA(Gln) amidotransferase A subunit family amidase
MPDLDLCYTSAMDLCALYRAAKLSPVEVIENSLARIEEVNPLLNCFCFTYAEEALEQAHAAERAFQSGTARPLEGIPVAIKDFTPTRGKVTTRGSRLLEHWIPERSAVLVERLEAAGAIMVGKTTTPEFATSGFTDSPLWGRTLNPWNLERTCGGSSGGSAAAVASGCVPFAEGTDMGGSVRIPAALCGIVGLKPSLGRIPMDIIDTTFDNISHFGPLARTVSDAALFLDIVQGESARDIQSLPRCDMTIPVPSEIRGLSLAYCIDQGFCAVEDGVVDNLMTSISALRDAGADVTEVALDWDRRIVDLWYEIWSVYMAAAYDRVTSTPLDENRDCMSEGLVALIETGRGITALQARKGDFERTRYWHKLARILEDHHALLCPTMAIVAPPATMKDSDFGEDDVNGKMKCMDMTGQFNLTAQCPALSVPSGFSHGLPTAVQIIARKWNDPLALRIGAALEAALPWTSQRPSGRGRF